MTDKATTWEVKARSVAARVTFTPEEFKALRDTATASGTSVQHQLEAEALRRLNDGRVLAVFGGVSLTLAGIEERAFPPADTETSKQIGCVLNLTTEEAAVVMRALERAVHGGDHQGDSKAAESARAVYQRIQKLQQAEQVEA